MEAPTGEPTRKPADHRSGVRVDRRLAVPARRFFRLFVGGRELHRRESLETQVVAALLGSGYPALASVGCEIDRQRVILRGSVPSYHHKQLAQVFVQRVEGVGRIENRLQVRSLDNRRVSPS